MDSARADMLAAKNQLQSQGWIARRSEAFHHLPPPALAQWLESEHAGACDAPLLAGAGWTLQPLGQTPASGVDARWLDALEPAQRAELFAGLPAPEGEAAPFAWAHRALCRQGLRLRIAATPGKAASEHAPVWLHLAHQPRAQAEAPLLVLDVEAGMRCVLLETHERDADACAQGVAQNLHAHIRLAAGAQLQHLRVVAPQAKDRTAHHLHATLAKDAHYAQALVALGSGYHLQRTRLDLQGAGARARSAGLLLTGEQTLDQQVYTYHNAPRTSSRVEALALASGSARTVGNSFTRIAPGASDASVFQRLSGVALDGQPRMVLRPHLEILHDQVQALHGATWGRLPEDALFYARQRGLDEASARALIIEGMAHALLARGFDDADAAEDSPLLAQWLEQGWLTRAIARLLEPRHG